MTTSLTTTRRLLDPAEARADLTRPALDTLLTEIERSGLTGRGGAGFPTSAKVRAVASGARRPVVVGNGMEGEPLSSKDAVLLAHSPDLVLDGLEVLARAMRARRGVLAVGPEADPAPATAAARARRVEVVQLDGGFVSGQETALVGRLNGRPGLPRDPFTRVSESGVAGRPTLVLNVETLAQVALVARHGADWFRSAGTRDDPGTSLFTISGAVQRPGVVEADRGTRLCDVIAPAWPVRPVAVLVGGYHGAWVPAADLGVGLTRRDLAAYGAAVGAGVLHVLGEGGCPLAFAADVADYLAGESARQCGPCVNGLPHVARNLRRLAAGVRDRSLPAEIARMAQLVTGRGACAHPDGTLRFVGSTLEVFAGHVAAHLEGWCPTSRQAVAS
ncbi:MAG TPA: NADH-ubiquinone oxidoreductase-F iron-sulfur binding region domain-containing protein [Nocardioides sp.]|jgi:NADH:ubiquinone oxidoreductase subunit F (NADH-binding)|uniref:NADH-ubiquinone oxidoreductase-F iron-sulfur binding region domain-containing protein n=1 Tax=Nocardioides sp. TaxID=35761 RepID=UPI002E329237|nr:NADH-ubiquinone oxidoreductase-F iron-sulfur binding region domain-containing protein [Nocardioides sp.]HEX3930075.1 NADH-ubiquinone oxidoreductase-F iron-sulfur binding region domain-containing protein [Nocardioides sp.]